MIDKRRFKQTVGTALEEFGFQRQGSAWRLVAEQVAVVVDLQKSGYDNTFFMNVSFRVLCLETDAGEDDWHIICRIERLIHLASEKAAAFVVDSSELTTDEHVSLLRELISNDVGPHLVRLLTIEGLCAAYRDGSFDACMVDARVARFLGNIH